MYNFTFPLTGHVTFRVRVTLRLTVSQSVCLGVEPYLGFMTRFLFIYFFESYSVVSRDSAVGIATGYGLDD
jgi:hypothetical protein